MNARLASGPFPFASSYDAGVVVQAWAAAEVRFVGTDAGEDCAGEDQDLSSQPLGYDRPYSGRAAAGALPPLQAVNADAHEQARDEHHRLCQQLLDRLAAAGLAAGEHLRAFRVDIAWRDAAGRQFIAEVKSRTGGDGVGPLRLGLGQILEYRQRLRSEGIAARAILLVSDVDDPLWYDVCGGVDVLLVTAGREDDWERLFGQRTDPGVPAMRDRHAAAAL